MAPMPRGSPLDQGSESPHSPPLPGMAVGADPHRLRPRLHLRLSAFFPCSGIRGRAPRGSEASSVSRPGREIEIPSNQDESLNVRPHANA